MTNEEKIEILKKALEEIKKSEGAYSRDQQEFANNVIENSKELATKALEAILEPKVAEPKEIKE